MEFTKMIVPEVIVGFNVYDGDGDLVVGVTDKMSLAKLASKVATITGAGIAGSYNVPVVGHYDSITQVVPFRVAYKPMFELANPMKITTLNIRGAIQVTDKSTGLSDYAGVRYMVKGRAVETDPGELENGAVMGASVTIEATTVIYEIDGKKLIELDKMNGIYRIDGIDYLEKVRKLC